MAWTLASSKNRECYPAQREALKCRRSPSALPSQGRDLREAQAEYPLKPRAPSRPSVTSARAVPRGS